MALSDLVQGLLLYMASISSAFTKNYGVPSECTSVDFSIVTRRRQILQVSQATHAVSMIVADASAAQQLAQTVSADAASGSMLTFLLAEVSVLGSISGLSLELLAVAISTPPGTPPIAVLPTPVPPVALLPPSSSPLLIGGGGSDDDDTALIAGLCAGGGALIIGISIGVFVMMKNKKVGAKVTTAA